MGTTVFLIAISIALLTFTAMIVWFCRRHYDSILLRLGLYPVYKQVTPPHQLAKILILQDV